VKEFLKSVTATFEKSRVRVSWLLLLTHSVYFCDPKVEIVAGIFMCCDCLRNVIEIMIVN